MIYLLDTNVCIRYLNGQSAAIRSRLERTEPKSISLCSVVKAELFFGAVKSRAIEENLAKLGRFFAVFASHPFDDRAAASATLKTHRRKVSFCHPSSRCCR